MIIAFDLDKVFINYPPGIPDSVIDFFYKHRSPKLSYKIPTHPLDIAIRKLSHIDIFRPPIMDNIEYLKELHSSGKHSLHLVSSRYKFLNEKTLGLLKKYKIYNCFDSINLNLENEQAHLFKYRILKKLSADKFIDDDRQLLEYLSTTDLKTRLLWLSPEKNLKELFNQA